MAANGRENGFDTPSLPLPESSTDRSQTVQLLSKMSPVSFEKAVPMLVDEFHWNSWFLETYWPENAPRMELMAQLAIAHSPKPEETQLLEVGCANGYAAALFRLLGFQVAAADAYDDPRREELFLKLGIPYTSTNLNDPKPLLQFADGSFDCILLGEVFEHILNNPLELLKALNRILKPGGQLILTTPNPSTIANSIRVLQDNYILWGSKEFARISKFDGARIIDEGAIHYCEYPMRVTGELMQEAGFQIGLQRYVAPGWAPTQSPLKRLLKRLLKVTRLDRRRLLCPGYLVEGFKSGH